MILLVIYFKTYNTDLLLPLSAFHAAGECRRQVKNLIHFVKNVKIVEFHNHIWNHHGKSIQKSTNMPSIGLVIPEIISEMLEF